MSRLSIIEEVGVISGANYKEVENPFKVEAECIGCDTTVDVTQCGGNMCYFCWSKENE